MEPPWLALLEADDLRTNLPAGTNNQDESELPDESYKKRVRIRLDVFSRHPDIKDTVMNEEYCRQHFGQDAVGVIMACFSMFASLYRDIDIERPIYHELFPEKADFDREINNITTVALSTLYTREVYIAYNFLRNDMPNLVPAHSAAKGIDVLNCTHEFYNKTKTALKNVFGGAINADVMRAIPIFYQDKELLKDACDLSPHGRRDRACIEILYQLGQRGGIL